MHVGTRQIGKMLTLVALMAIATAGTSATVFAQGVQTGIMTGIVKDAQDLPVPGATVTVTSPALQGGRTVVTDEIGAYIIRGLPPGTYKTRFELSGMTPVEDNVDVPLGGTAKLDATMKVASVAEAITVTADLTPAPIATTQTSANYRAELISALPIDRRPAWIAELSPGLTDNTPNTGQVTIGGAFAYDNVFLIDGVDTNDNLFGTSNNLFIEDAIEETQVLTSGISAEYGRFSGGVINVISKRGGNDFHGSFRTNFSRPSWSVETPFEKERGQKRSTTLSKYFEGTIGGPILRDRLWFFNADRYENSKTPNALREVGTPYAVGVNNKRFDIKMTGTVGSAQRFEGSYLNNPTDQTSRPSLNADFSIDPAVLVDRQLPNKLWIVNWNGVLTQKLFGTFQVSRKEQGFRNTGGKSQDIHDSPFRARGVLPGNTLGNHYNAPFFSSFDPEDRNNRQFTGSLSYYFTDGGIGRHDFKTGFEHYTSTRTGGNSQSATGYVFQTDHLVAPGGGPVVDAAGHPIPVWGGNPANPGTAATRIQNWRSVQGAQIDIKTLSLYLQDRWTVNDRLGVDLGVRYEKVRSDATGDLVGADTDTIVPRLGLSYDITGNGQTVLQTTYAHYAGKYSEAQFARNTNVGSPSLVTMGYVGPNGVGLNFAPGYDLSNYVIIGGNFPTANVFFEDGLSSPTTREFTASLGRELPRGGHFKAVYVWRNTRDFIDDFIDDPSPGGKITVIRDGTNFGTFDRVVYRNTNLPQRKYQALQFASRARFTDRWWVEGHWTVQLRNHGTFEGEATNQPGNPSDIADYPEILVPSRNFPYGRLDDFQRHKIRLWTTYSQGLGRFGRVDVAPIVRINSAQTYSLIARNVPLSSLQLARNPGYARLPANGVNSFLYFGERGSENFKGFGVLDLALSYGIPVWKSVRPWLQLQTFNVLNNQELIAWDRTVTPDNNGPRDEQGLPTQFIKGPNFGKGTLTTHYPVPLGGENGGRTFRIAFGLRF